MNRWLFHTAPPISRFQPIHTQIQRLLWAPRPRKGDMTPPIHMVHWSQQDGPANWTTPSYVRRLCAGVPFGYVWEPDLWSGKWANRTGSRCIHFYRSIPISFLGMEGMSFNSIHDGGAFWGWFFIRIVINDLGSEMGVAMDENETITSTIHKLYPYRFKVP